MGVHGVILLFVGPVVGVLIALAFKARAWAVLAASVLGGIVVYVGVLAWSRYAMMQMGADGAPAHMAPATVGLRPWLVAFAVLLVLALLVGALGIAVRYAVRGDED